MKALLKSDPESIGPFKLVARLGAGGMGIVYLATRGTQSVALKVLNSVALDNQQARKRFRKEVDTLRQITSEYVAKVVDSDLGDEYCWLAVEFVNGPDLKALVEDRGPLSEDEWMTLAHGLLSGIKSIHGQGLIHRDIKPANILIADTGPKIIDFGIAQDLDATSLTMTGSVAGSPAWLSPEQIDGANLTQATDLFSAGSVLHFAASGVSPWGDQSTSATSVVFNNILTKDPDTSGLPEPQKTLVEALIKKNPDERLTAGEALDLLGSIRKNQGLSRIDNTISSPRPNRSHTENFNSKTESKGTSGSKVVFGAIAAAGLVAALLVVPTLANQSNFVCAETSYSQGDLTESSLEALEASQFPNVLSRACVPIDQTSISFDIEYCVYRDKELEIAEASRHRFTLLGGDQRTSETIGFSQASGGTFGCRSLVQLGLLSEAESRATALGLSLSRQIPFLDTLGNLKSNESRFELISDGTSGTFVTKYYGSSAEDLAVSLSVPVFSQLILSAKYKSGYLPNWSTKKEYADYIWTIDGLSASASSCYFDGYVAELGSSGQKVRLESFQKGSWVPISSHKKANPNYCEDSTELETVISEQEALQLLEVRPCNQIRRFEPATASYRSDSTIFCLSLEEVTEASNDTQSQNVVDAVESAKSYLDSSYFSRKSLIGQLEYEGFSKSEATAAVDSLDVDWYSEAAEGAKSWIESEYFDGTRQNILDILVGVDQFTQDQGEYGATSAGY